MRNRRKVYEESEEGQKVGKKVEKGKGREEKSWKKHGTESLTNILMATNLGCIQYSLLLADEFSRGISYLHLLNRAKNKKNESFPIAVTELLTCQ
jgi:hypothetical protein